MGDDSRQYGFEVESGADYLADFAEGFELAYRACQFVGSLIQFFEQADVLDGDHRLVGEGFEELDLRRGEGAHLGATRVQCSNEFPLLTKGNSQEGAQAAGSPTLENHSAHEHRECGACHARASSDTVAHQY